MAAKDAELVLVLGDAHVPFRAAGIPSQFANILVPDKITHVLATGNLCTVETLEYLKGIAPHVYVARGDFDDASMVATSVNPNAVLPEEVVVEIGEFRIGVIHGHQVVPWGDHEALGMVARRLGVDILVSGNTHLNETVELDGVLLVNPGSVTGAYSPICETARPSFVCMSIRSDQVTCYVYELAESGEVQVHKTKFTKGGSNNGATGGDEHLFGFSGSASRGNAAASPASSPVIPAQAADGSTPNSATAENLDVAEVEASSGTPPKAAGEVGGVEL